MTDLFGLSTMASNTQFAPLALLGYRLHQRDFFGPLREQVQLPQKSVLYTPYDKLLTCLVSIMSGCHAVCQIDTRIRPDRALAQAWGLENFAQQSTVATTLDCFTEFGVQQLRTATGQIYSREGKAPRHDYAQEGHLILDIDLTGLPASQHAEGSTKGYFSGKKGGTGDNWHVSVLPSTMKLYLACYTPAIKHQSIACAPPLKS
jgi:hypothetical protein